MNPFVYKIFPLSQNLADVNAYLRQQGIEHRFTEERNGQALWLIHPDHVPVLDDFFEAYEQKTIHIQTSGSKTEPAKRNMRKYLLVVLENPLTILCIIFGFVGLVLTESLNGRQLYDCCLYMPFSEAVESGRYWQMLTPTFLHFGWMHWLFNSLWLWMIGRMLEPYLGVFNYMLLFLVTALMANVAQFMSSGAVNFGGLSGVVYGYFGFIFVANLLRVDARLFLPSGMFVFFALSLVAGFFGVFEVFSVHVANWAHLGGLLAGIALAGIMFYRSVYNLFKR